MPIATGLLVLTLFGADGPPAPDPAPLDYQIRILDMKGLDWRGAAHDRLTPVTRQGSATVWTAERGLAAELAGKAEQVASAPRIRALPGVLTEVRDEVRQGIVADLTRIADGPVGQATTVAFQPRIDQVRLGFHARLSCRKLDQGMLARVQLEDSRLAAIHTATLHEDLKPDGKTEFKARYQVPEVVQSSAEGEWLIPHDGALVVGFGPHTMADAKGLAVVHERVVLIEARPASQVREETPTARPANPLTDPNATTAVYLRAEPGSRPARPTTRQVTVGSPLPFPILGALPGWVFLPIHLPAAPTTAPDANKTEPAARTSSTPTLPTPAPPSRILPTPRAADGTITELPPLPDNDTHPASLEESRVPRPSPQSPARTTPRSGSKPTDTPDHGSAGQPAPPMSRAPSPEPFVGSGSVLLNGQPAPPMSKATSPNPDPDSATSHAALSSHVASETVVDNSVVKTEHLDVKRGAASPTLHQAESCCSAPSACESQTPAAAAFRRSFTELNRLIEMLTDRDPRMMKDNDAHKLGYIDITGSSRVVRAAGQELKVGGPTATARVQIKGRQLSIPVDLESVSNTPLTVRIPLGGGEVVEIRASVVRPSAEPSECCAEEK